jgi:hypothetical protein
VGYLGYLDYGIDLVANLKAIAKTTILSDDLEWLIDESELKSLLSDFRKKYAEAEDDQMEGNLKGSSIEGAVKFISSQSSENQNDTINLLGDDIKAEVRVKIEENRKSTGNPKCHKKMKKKISK